MNRSERERIIQESQLDEARKDRDKFDYASDIVTHSPDGIWVEPNSVAKRLRNKEIRYGEQPFDRDNAIQTGYCIKDQVEFVAAHDGAEMLCEAVEEDPCIQKDCPLFSAVGSTSPMRNRYGHPFCVEFKIAFEKKQ